METVVTRVNEFQREVEYSFDEWLERGRQWWKASASRVIECEYLLVIDAGNVVRAAARVEGVLRDLRGGSGRVGIMAIPDPDNEWIGQEIQRPDSRNPVVYLTKVIAA